MIFFYFCFVGAVVLPFFSMGGAFLNPNVEYWCVSPSRVKQNSTISSHPFMEEDINRRTHPSQENSTNLWYNDLIMHQTF